ncbi:MAG: hypothetical protein ABFS10_09220 [Bacteroidota bacterium]
MEPSRRILRRMQYLRDQDGIMNRYLREGTNWESHLHKTKAFITSSFKDQSLDSIAILGSGWLLDVPLEELNRRFKKIYLVDIVHPPQVKKRTEAMERVELVEADLTGGAIEQVWREVKQRGSRRGECLTEHLISNLKLESPLHGINPDAIASVNLLNQLDILLVEFMEKHGYFKQESPDAFRKLIQTFHLEWITRTPGSLVTDTVEVNRDKNGNESTRPLLYTGLPEGARSEQWKWRFDSRGTYRHNTLTHMEVRAVEWS